MNLLISLNKPEYIFRPVQILRRFSREWASAKQFEDVTLPWGLNIRVRPNETIGSCIWRVGIYDLCISECIWRLLDPGDYAVDVGANIGHMTSIMALRTGRLGNVLAFEPHPEIYEELSTNVDNWLKRNDIGRIVMHKIALGNCSGAGFLEIPDDFERNRGIAALISGSGEGNAGTGCRVQVEQLDHIIDSKTCIGVLKIDVEGDELEVLQGASELIERQVIRDILFEEHAQPPTPVTSWLEKNGYAVFYLDQRLLGVKAVSISETYRVRGRRDSSNLLATIDKHRALKRLQSKGWNIFGSKFK